MDVQTLELLLGIVIVLTGLGLFVALILSEPPSPTKARGHAPTVNMSENEIDLVFSDHRKRWEDNQ